MDLYEGDYVKYTFPEPANNGVKEITGVIKAIGETFVVIRSVSGVQIKVSFKNFDHIHPLIESEMILAERDYSL